MVRIRRLLVIFAAVVPLLMGIPLARSQTSTTGAIRGTVRDASTGHVLPGVTVVATSPALQGSQAEISDAQGRYLLTNLPPGNYLLTFYYSEAKVEVTDVRVHLGQTRVVNQRLNPATGEVIVIEDRGTIVDPTSTSQGSLVTQEQMQNIPVPGRTFADTLGQAPGSQGDSQGVSFSGSTSLENQYIIDGVNTTGLTYGTVGTPLINEFIEEIQIITGGYQAEYGRATGGVVNVITKQGSNEFHGSVFSTVVPYQVNRTPVREIGTSIDGTVDLDYQVDFGFDAGGPLVKDKVWFYVGFGPQLWRYNVSRVVQRNVDCHDVLPDGTLSSCDPQAYEDGSPDEDPDTGDLIFEKVDETAYKIGGVRYQMVTKINFALRPEHQGQVSLLGAPRSGEGYFTVSGSPTATRADLSSLNTDMALKWNSKFNDNKTELELVAGWHRDRYNQYSLDPLADAVPTTRVYFSDLHHFGQAGNETSATMAGCTDSNDRGVDPYPYIDNCPVTQYWLDSPGFTIDSTEDRRSVQLKVTQRLKLAGSHVLKAGTDIEDNVRTDLRHYTGGEYYRLVLGGYDQVHVFRWVSPNESGADVCGFENGDPELARGCDFLARSTSVGNTLNWSAFAQDSWQVRPNLTVNAGLRYEEQRLRYAERVRDTIDPFTEEPLGKNALILDNMWAPRLGVLYDWTKEGRSKVYASVGRFYESIPMKLNDFSFAGDTLYAAFWRLGQCFEGSHPSPDSTGAAPNPRNCPQTIEAGNQPEEDYYLGGTTLVTPGTKAQYLDEAIIGVEHEILEDFTLGVTLKMRTLGRVLEDVSPDNATTYLIGNPGYFASDEEERILAELERLDPESDEYSQLETRLEQYRTLRIFDKPRREYRAIELTAVKRFSRDFYLQASYTYQRTRGNYPGLLNDDTGEVWPNVSTAYDLPELLANRVGPLPQDRPHYMKLDGYYIWRLGKTRGALTGGVRFRALSGSPLDALGSHYLYGYGEAFVLPRGSQGRTDFVTGTDLHVSYSRDLAAGYELSAFADVINLFNQEQIAVRDELYTYDNVNPIVGGTMEDLVFAKQATVNGEESNDPAGRNIAFGTPLARYTPLFLRFGVRLRF